MDSIQEKIKRISIRGFNDFNNELFGKGYNLIFNNEEEFVLEISKVFPVNIKVLKYIYNDLSLGEVKYKVYDIDELFSYISSILEFEKSHKGLWNKVNHIQRLAIHRVEYDRVMGIQEDVSHILNVVEALSENISSTINEEDKLSLKEIEDELDRDYLFTKDIELLKKILTLSSSKVSREYNSENLVNTVIINMPDNISLDYVKPIKGSVLHQEYVYTNLPRINRLIRNLDKYITNVGNGMHQINQSRALQDTINIAAATYNGHEFKSISGSNEIEGYCMSPKINKGVFISRKVNKLGKLGIGYNRINDSEKKILEHIDSEIGLGNLNDSGEITLYTKWKPCKSCYYVMHQFMEKHPNIRIKVNYHRQYGEKD
ncbi:MAG: deaminase domain-containing protein [Clostridium sp.]